jgi:hypothetical protein
MGSNERCGDVTGRRRVPGCDQELPRRQKGGQHNFCVKLETRTTMPAAALLQGHGALGLARQRRLFGGQVSTCHPKYSLLN